MANFVPLDEIRGPTDFGEREYPGALVNVTNVCNLSCTHCFVFRADNPNKPKDKMNDATMLAQLEMLRDKHNIKSMLFMGGEPMIRKKLVLECFVAPHLLRRVQHGALVSSQNRTAGNSHRRC